jgi:hypothetical protein
MGKLVKLRHKFGRFFNRTDGECWFFFEGEGGNITVVRVLHVVFVDAYALANAFGLFEEKRVCECIVEWTRP